jgi:hypothetical protein
MQAAGLLITNFLLIRMLYEAHMNRFCIFAGLLKVATLAIALVLL